MDDVTEMLEIEKIKQLKYRYLRFLDTKEWDSLGALFSENARSAYGDGRYSFEGRDAIMKFLVDSLGRASILTAHHGHHPEIELTSESTATGTWALWDTVIDLEHGFTLRGAAFYTDEYVKQDGEWRFRSTGYRRTYEEMEPRSDALKLTSNRFAEG